MVILKNKNSIVNKVFGYAFIMTFLALMIAAAVRVNAYTCKPGDTECEAEKSQKRI